MSIPPSPPQKRPAPQRKTTASFGDRPKPDRGSTCSVCQGKNLNIGWDINTGQPVCANCTRAHEQTQKSALIKTIDAQLAKSGIKAEYEFPAGRTTQQLQLQQFGEMATRYQEANKPAPVIEHEPEPIPPARWHELVEGEMPSKWHWWSRRKWRKSQENIFVYEVALGMNEMPYLTQPSVLKSREARRSIRYSSAGWPAWTSSKRREEMEAEISALKQSWSGYPEAPEVSLFDDPDVRFIFYGHQWYEKHDGVWHITTGINYDHVVETQPPASNHTQVFETYSLPGLAMPTSHGIYQINQETT